LLIDKKTDFDQENLSFTEIDAGFSTREAITEAKRCLNCPKPACRSGCPIENEIPQFIQALAVGNVGSASEIISLRSNLPAVCGRVCPHEKQCEGACVLTKKNSGIRIGKLERFIADFAAEMELGNIPQAILDKGKVAVIGSGPAGLTVAGDLAKLGYQVTVFEAQAEPGGVLLYGIPEFRLSKEVVRREINNIAKLGVIFETNVLIGTQLTVDELLDQSFDAVFIGTGTALPKTLELPGKNLPGVVQATYFLGMVALSLADKLDQREIPVSRGDKVVIVGAGNVAMDAARTALRLGAAAVTVVYRRTENEITALQAEYLEAVKEGVHFQWLANPVEFVDQAGHLAGLKCELLQVEATGEVHPTGQIQVLPADKVILAIGQRPAARIVSSTTGIEVNPFGFVVTKSRPYGMTTRRGVFAGGDVVHEPATVVLAMKEAKKVAAGIALYVEAKKLMEDC
jgi:glutamate synthase (NADPH/NADH) small chain